MRLLNTRTHEFKEFFEANIPRYAILSHTWTDSEVSYKEFRKGPNQESVSYRKIINACDLARDRNLDWIWIDTCCIDKRSSAELAEAINSMFKWYRKSHVCYVYLNDVAYGRQPWQPPSYMLEEFKQSRWFKRGWTLQELLASTNVSFHNQDWNFLGDKHGLSSYISEVTGIHAPYLDGTWDVRDASVACKMSWASYRKTTRPEDIAYSLLGLFDVNMPLLYGEGGTKAFVRLQLEIIKKSDDETIFAWYYGENPNRTGMLALTPAAFARSGLTFSKPSFDSALVPPYHMTHRGLMFKRPLFRHLTAGIEELYELPLRCEYRHGMSMSITLEPTARNGDILMRVHYLGHGEDLDRRVVVTRPETHNIKEFFVYQEGL